VKNIVFGFVGALVGSVAVFAAWLIWPMPSPAFEWRTMVTAQGAAGECFDHTTSLASLTLVDPDGVETYLDEMPLTDRCDYAAIGRAEAANDEASVRNQIEETRRMARSLGAELSSINLALSEWRANRAFRRMAGQGVMGVPELVLAFRCERPLSFERRADWLWAYRYLDESNDEPPVSIRRWQGRLSWCRGFAEHQLNVLGLAEEGPAPKTEADLAADALANVYLGPLQSWRLQYD